jgi:hypothetical protein
MGATFSDRPSVPDPRHVFRPAVTTVLEPLDLFGQDTGDILKNILGGLSRFRPLPIGEHLAEIVVGIQNPFLKLLVGTVPKHTAEAFRQLPVGATHRLKSRD